MQFFKLDQMQFFKLARERIYPRNALTIV